jgi:hypothetical protein
MLTAHDQRAGLSVDTASYRQSANSRPPRINIALNVDWDLNPTTTDCINTAEDRLHSDSPQVAASFNSVATRHLQEQTRTNARIADEGYALTIGIDIPAASESAAQQSSGEADAPLTAEQEHLLPSLRTAIALCLPDHERHHTDSLALQAIQQVPPAAEIIRATDRVQVDEVIGAHIRRMENYTQMTLPQSRRLAELSFPQHSSAALNYHRPSTSPAPANTSRSPRISPSIER